MTLRILLTLISTAFLFGCATTTEPPIIRDAQGRIIKQTDQKTGIVTEWTYTDSGKTKITTLGKTTVKHIYDKRDMLLRFEQQPENIVWEFEYTPAGNIKTIKNPKGKTVQYVYSRNGKPIEKIYPDGTIEKDPAPPANPLLIVQGIKSTDYKPRRTEKVHKNMRSTIHSYTIPGQYRYK